MTLVELVEKANRLAAELEDTRNEIAWKQSEHRAEVQMTKKDGTYIMQHNDRTIKVKAAGPYNRYRVTEGRKVLVRESMYPINKIRLDFALGRI